MARILRSPGSRMALSLPITSLFEYRQQIGAAREDHGDLRADHLIVNDQVRVVDCVEFDPQLRELDVADDLAFLMLDLTLRGGGRFAEQLVRAYRDAGGDPGPDALISFYAVHRALVRAKRRTRACTTATRREFCAR